jgi:hypothetical protein
LGLIRSNDRRDLFTSLFCGGILNCIAAEDVGWAVG